MRKIILLASVSIGIVISIIIARFIPLALKDKPLYGNNIASIEKIIVGHSLVTMPIEIIGIEDIYNQRIVGFIENGIHLGVAILNNSEVGEIEIIANDNLVLHHKLCLTN